MRKTRAKSWRRLRMWGALAACWVLVLGACATTANGKPNAAMAHRTEFTDFATLTPPSSPNAWLIAPADVVAGEPDESAPIFSVPADTLANAWAAVVDQQPRAKVLAVSADGLQVEAEQRSALFGFVDRISVRFIPLDRERATLCAYSRAQLGYWDLGVNRHRLHDWITQLEEQTSSEDGTAGESKTE